MALGNDRLEEHPGDTPPVFEPYFPSEMPVARASTARDQQEEGSARSCPGHSFQGGNDLGQHDADVSDRSVLFVYEYWVQVNCADFRPIGNQLR